MKITCQRSILAAALKSCASVADAKSTMPELSMVRLTTNDGRLRCVATDLNVSIAVYVPCEGSDGDVLVPAAGIAKAVDLLPGDTVSVEVSNTSLLLTTGRIKQVVPLGGEPSRHPKQPVIAETWGAMPADALLHVLRGCLPAVCHDETRFHLNGVLLECDGSVVMGQATDGHRAHVMRRSCEATIPMGIIPARGCERIVAMLDGVETVQVAHSDRYRHLKAGETTLSVKVIDAKFPPLEQVIPKYQGSGVVISRGDLLGAARRVGFATDDNHGMVIDVAADAVSFEAKTTSSGFSAEESYLLDTDETRITAAVNPHYLADAVKSLEGDRIALRFGGALDPIAITDADACLGPKAVDVVVIMPMRGQSS